VGTIETDGSLEIVFRLGFRLIIFTMLIVPPVVGAMAYAPSGAQEQSLWSVSEQYCAQNLTI